MTVSEELLNSKLETVEARTETKFAQLLGELRLISSNVASLGTRIDDVRGELGTVRTELGNVRNATAGVKWNILGASIGLAAVILGLFAYGQQMLQLAAQLVGLKS